MVYVAIFFILKVMVFVFLFLNPLGRVLSLGVILRNDRGQVVSGLNTATKAGGEFDVHILERSLFTYFHTACQPQWETTQATCSGPSSWAPRIPVGSAFQNPVQGLSLVSHHSCGDCVTSPKSCLAACSSRPAWPKTNTWVGVELGMEEKSDGLSHPISSTKATLMEDSICHFFFWEDVTSPHFWTVSSFLLALH